MGNLLDGLLGGGGGGGGGGGYGGGGGSYGYGPELQCCEPVVDPLSLLAALGAIAALSLFLRQAVIDNMITGRKKRSHDGSLADDITEVLFSGKHFKLNEALLLRHQIKVDRQHLTFSPFLTFIKGLPVAGSVGGIFSSSKARTVDGFTL